MKILFFQAECGDAALIRFMDSNGLPRNVFIDSGYERTYATVVRQVINEIIAVGERVDLWIISHIHADHIGGAYTYINAIKQGYINDVVNEWVYNDPRIENREISSSNEHTNLISEASSPKSIRHNDTLTYYLRSVCKIPAQDYNYDTPKINLFGLLIDVISPDKESLQSIRRKYANNAVTLEVIEGANISEAKAAKGRDYNIRISEFDLNSKIWVEDDSIENASSIAVITEFNNKKVLWLADAHPSILIKALSNLGYSRQNPIKCEWVKVAHHGSKGNSSSDLYDFIICSNYIFSSNGLSPNYLPNKEAIAMILRSNTRVKGEHYNLYFTYKNRVLESMFDIDGKSVFSEFDFSVHLNDENKWIEVVL